jgi:hypothetical protein
MKKSFSKECIHCKTSFQVDNASKNKKHCTRKCYLTNKTKMAAIKIEEARALINDNPNALTCLECGYRAINSIMSHISKMHAMLIDDYYQKHNVGAEAIISKETKAKLSEAVLGDKNPAWQHGGRLSPFSKKFIKYTTPEEATVGIIAAFKKTGAAQADHGSTKLKYYLDKGLSQADAQAALTDRQQTFTLEKCIARLGEIEGRKRWEERQEKWLAAFDSKSDEEMEAINRSKIYKSGISKISKVLFAELDCEGCKHWGRDKELCIKFPQHELEKRKYCFVDFSLGKKVIEFYGTYWHADPRKYKPDSIIYASKKRQHRADKIWISDLERQRLIENAGYQVYIVWEEDYIKDPTAVTLACKRFLHDS